MAIHLSWIIIRAKVTGNVTNCCDTSDLIDTEIVVHCVKNVSPAQENNIHICVKYVLAAAKRFPPDWWDDEYRKKGSDNCANYESLCFMPILL